MKLIANFPTALEALNRNKFRSFLTTLGVVIGIGAVVFTVSIGRSIKTFVSNELDRFVGATIFGVGRPRWVKLDSGRWGPNPFQGNLWTDEVKAIKNECPSIKSIAGWSFIAGGSLNVSHGDRIKSMAIVGVTPELSQVFQMSISFGRFIRQDDLDQSARVCVLGDEARKDLFGNQNPVGQEITVYLPSYWADWLEIESTPLPIRLKVIGLMEEKGTTYTKQMGWHIDKLIMTPVTTLNTYFGKKLHQNLELYMHSFQPDLVNQAQTEVQLILQRRFGYQNLKYFEFGSAKQELDRVGKVSLIIQLVFGFAAGISLLVGGIGTMNIMLVSVTQRTQEIGLRKAVGATSYDIRIQFILESVLLCLVGGIIGTLMASVISLLAGWGISTFLVKDSSWPSAISFQTATIAFSVSTLVGICSGFYPANRAAQLEPTEAMRFE